MGLALLASAVFVSDAHDGPTGGDADKVGVRQMVRDKRVVLTGRGEPHRAGGHQPDGDAGGILRIQLEMYNLKRTVQNFFYTVEWFDADGMRVETATGG
jgi:hypothetical protein